MAPLVERTCHVTAKRHIFLSVIRWPPKGIEEKKIVIYLKNNKKENSNEFFFFWVKEELQ